MRRSVTPGEFAIDSPTRVLITGATSAIGSALAVEYANSGVKLYLHGRNALRLREVADCCVARGAEVQTKVLDLLNIEACKQWISSIDPIDLLICNAGINTHIGQNGNPEPLDEVEALLDVNLKAVLVTVQTLIPGMRLRGSGQIALVSSLAGYFGLPITPTYCATKAGLKAYGEALRGWLGPEGIRVNVIMPGYVSSPMCDGMPGPKPLLWSPERAARAIKRGLEADRARISFPFPLNFGAWLLAVLPTNFSIHLLHWLGFAKARD